MLVQHGVDALLALHTAQACKCLADDHGFEMTAVTSDGQVITCEADTNPVLDLLGVKHDGWAGVGQESGSKPETP